MHVPVRIFQKFTILTTYLPYLGLISKSKSNQIFESNEFESNISNIMLNL